MSCHELRLPGISRETQDRELVRTCPVNNGSIPEGLRKSFQDRNGEEKNFKGSIWRCKQLPLSTIAN
jgi:hypothetical protein